MVPVLVGVNNRVERQTVIVKKCVDQFVAPGIDDNDGAIIQHNKIGEVAQLTVGVNGVDLHGNLEVNWNAKLAFYNQAFEHFHNHIDGTIFT